MLIHLSSDQAGMDNIYAGETCIQHINSAIFVAGLVDCPVLALTMEATREVTGALRDNYLNAAVPDQGL